jgi:hypothetical protein
MLAFADPVPHKVQAMACPVEYVPTAQVVMLVAPEAILLVV